MLKLLVDEQCSATHSDGCSGYLYCVRKVKHRGLHTDHFDWWWKRPLHSLRPIMTFKK